MQDRFVELEGTWEEIRAHDAELAGKRVRLTVLEGEGAESRSSRRLRKEGADADAVERKRCEAAECLLERFRQGIDFGGPPYPKREELYDRGYPGEQTDG